MDQELNITLNALDETEDAFASVTEGLDGIGIAADETATSFEESVGQLNAAMDSFDANTAAMTSAFDEEVAGMATAFTAADEEIIAELDMNLAAALETADANVLNVGQAFTRMGAIGLIAFMTMRSQVTNAITDSQTWNQSLALIQSELKATGESIPIDTLTAYASKVQNTTLFTDQSALAAEAAILSNKNLAGSWRTMMPLAEDLATKMKGSLASAAGELAAAFTNPVDEMRKLVNAQIPIDPTMQRTIQALAQGGATAQASAILIEALRTSIGGAAATAAEAPGAGLTQFNNSLGTLNRILGEDLIPIFKRITDYIKPIVEEVIKWANAHKELAGWIDAGALALSGILAIMLPISLSLPAFTLAWKALSVVFEGIEIASGFLATSLGAAATGGLLFALMGLYVYVEKNYNGNFLTFFTSAFGGLKILATDVYNTINSIVIALENLWNTATNIAKSFGSGIGNAVSSVANFAGGLLPHFASGGIVSSPTIAMVGEAGPEAIIPLSMLGNGGSIGSGGTSAINVYITGTIQSTADQAKILGDEIARQIGRSLRLQTYK